MMEQNTMEVYELLCEKFLEIVAKHNNPVWAIDELEWLVYDVGAEQLASASEYVQDEVRHFMMSISKLYK